MWKWETVKGDNLVTEHTLKGPDVLCRYWYNTPPSRDARLIEASEELLGALENLLMYVPAPGGAFNTGPAINKARTIISRIKLEKPSCGTK